MVSEKKSTSTTSSAKAGESNTVFDDVFRTCLERLTRWVIPLVNEIFQENHPLDSSVIQFKNEHVTFQGKLVMDSHLFIGSVQIGKNSYHIECQSTADGNMVVRMVEYDFLIALEQIEEHNGIREIYFPKSAVLYLRHDKNTKDKEILKIHFPSGESVDYVIPIIKVQTYTKDELFDKKLLILLPFYMMRYEDQFAEISESSEKTQQFLNEYRELLDQIGNVLPEEQKGTVYRYLLDSIEKISNHLLRNREGLKEKAGEIMGGKLLHLPTDDIIAENQAIGMAIKSINLIRKKHDKKYTNETIADFTEEPVAMVEKVCKILDENPTWTDKQVYKKLIDENK